MEDDENCMQFLLSEKKPEKQILNFLSALLEIKIAFIEQPDSESRTFLFLNSHTAQYPQRLFLAPPIKLQLKFEIEYVAKKIAETFNVKVLFEATIKTTYDEDWVVVNPDGIFTKVVIRDVPDGVEVVRAK
jgi:hypothetical protein